MKKYVNGELVDMTSKDIAEANTISENIKQDNEILANQETNLKNLKASAKAKLIAGEALTAEEADTIVL